MKKVIIIIVILFIAIQFLPFGIEHNNPKITAEPEWNSTNTKELFLRTCGDCHSNQTKWPWYSNIAPVSWIISNHVNEGREKFNVSNWGNQKKNNGEDAADIIEDGEMPLKPYLLLHPEANLSKEEKLFLIEGLQKTFE